MVTFSMGFSEKPESSEDVSESESAVNDSFIVTGATELNSASHRSLPERAVWFPALLLDFHRSKSPLALPVHTKLSAVLIIYRLFHSITETAAPCTFVSWLVSPSELI